MASTLRGTNDHALIPAPGTRIIVRDAEWLVRRVDQSSAGGYAITAVGVAEPVRDQEAVFLTVLEPDLELVDPATTELIPDTSPYYSAARLFIDAALRRQPATGDAIVLGDRAVMDSLPFQLSPAAQALSALRARILIADTVGLGKTLEAGILASELLARHRARRILVVTTKSMLLQFQKEFWSRFSIALTRLDADSIARIRSRIPVNHNPFAVLDRVIVSMDTLKQDRQYRVHLEQAYWDLIIIDEAHNVAARGTGSLRARLARLLATRSDSLLMLSATPHDGRAESFASLMNMLDPTAIADPGHYGPDEIRGLFVRRFRADVADQLGDAFRPRDMAVFPCRASAAEEAAFQALDDLALEQDRNARSGSLLFRTVLVKSLFSSPAACLATIKQRLVRLPTEHADRAPLESLRDRVAAIDPTAFSRYQGLLDLIRNEFGWTGADPEDRLVIFTERIETQRFLAAQLPEALGLSASAVTTLAGNMRDVEQNRIVEAFGNRQSPLRLLIATDVASEGINLHFWCHRLVHFDIPWSLMTFAQRNGRIDRYGQRFRPVIRYLRTDAAEPLIAGDARILEVLIRKDAQAAANIGDPSALMGVYDIEAEEQITGNAIESGTAPERFEQQLTPAPDFLDQLLAGLEAPPTVTASAAPPRLFATDYEFLKQALQHLHVQARADDASRRLDFDAPEELTAMLRVQAPEIIPDGARFALSADKRLVRDAIEATRHEGTRLPAVQYLWPLHPIMEWTAERIVAGFPRQSAPVLVLADRLAANEVVVLVQGHIVNLRGQAVVQDTIAVRVAPDPDIESFAEFLHRTRLHDAPPNPNLPVDTATLSEKLPAAIEAATSHLIERRGELVAHTAPRLAEATARLDALRDRHARQIELDFERSAELETVRAGRREQRRRDLERMFRAHRDWVEQTLKTEPKPSLTVLAVFCGERA